MMKYNGGKDEWSEVKPGTDWKNIKNGNYYVYGKPVYAMGPGRVIRCWRNGCPLRCSSAWRCGPVGAALVWPSRIC